MNSSLLRWLRVHLTNYTPRCKGRLYTRERTSVKRQTEHRHLPSEREVLRCTAISNIKFNSSTATPGNVLREALSVIICLVLVILEYNICIIMLSYL